MDMSKHPTTDAAEDTVAPRHDRSPPGEPWAYLIALAWIAALVGGFSLAGLAGLVAVTVALVPLLVALLAAITIGR